MAFDAGEWWPRPGSEAYEAQRAESESLAERRFREEREAALQEQGLRDAI
jgi:hypothetical protein